MRSSLASPRLVSPRLISSRLARLFSSLLGLVSSRLVSSRLSPSRLVSSRQRRVLSRRVVSRHVASCRASRRTASGTRSHVQRKVSSVADVWGGVVLSGALLHRVSVRREQKQLRFGNEERGLRASGESGSAVDVAGALATLFLPDRQSHAPPRWFGARRQGPSVPRSARARRLTCGSF